ncbi:hypothetical protein ES332_A08G201000v1 [Gossypium tomentosum]|uniref:Uncharacterized protein n=1 Tax=Gossypium tomentosum TaxID=34277 RepID=A0A5D2PLB6_GOSTO|nr:hypothetical protein ES332_A08G201000v1 [Gossypium tomentosum]
MKLTAGPKSAQNWPMKFKMNETKKGNLILSYTNRNQQLDTISQCPFISPSQLLMIVGFKKSFSLLLPISNEGLLSFFSLVALANFSPVRDEHNLEHHPARDATLKWRTVFDAKISPPTSRTTIPEANLQDCWSKATSK